MDLVGRIFLACPRRASDQVEMKLGGRPNLLTLTWSYMTHFVEDSLDFAPPLFSGCRWRDSKHLTFSDYKQLFRLAGRAINYDATITKMPCHHDPSTARAPITLSTGSNGPQARFVMPVNFSQGWRLDRLLETTKWILLHNRI